jgi:hypothetical protein
VKRTNSRFVYGFLDSPPTRTGVTVNEPRRITGRDAHGESQTGREQSERANDVCRHP